MHPQTFKCETPAPDGTALPSTGAPLRDLRRELMVQVIQQTGTMFLDTLLSIFRVTDHPQNSWNRAEVLAAVDDAVRSGEIRLFGTVARDVLAERVQATTITLEDARLGAHDEAASEPVTAPRGEQHAPNALHE